MGDRLGRTRWRRGPARADGAEDRRSGRGDRQPGTGSGRVPDFDACDRSSLGWLAMGGQVDVRVLVVEDEQKVARALEEGLRGEGYEVVVEHSGEDAFFRINTERFDVALLDITL